MQINIRFSSNDLNSGSPAQSDAAELLDFGSFLHGLKFIFKFALPSSQRQRSPTKKITIKAHFWI